MNVAKTLIILNNIRKSKQDNTSIKHSLGKSGVSAVEIIDFEKNLEGLENFL